MRKMSMARQIRIQKLQNKNRMTGRTFNPSGVTSEELKTREENLCKKWRTMTDTELQEYYDTNLKKHHTFCHEKQISQSFEMCAFSRFIRFRNVKIA